MPLNLGAAWRIQLACPTIYRNSDHALGRASPSQVGYESEAAFNRAFKAQLRNSSGYLWRKKVVGPAAKHYFSPRIEHWPGKFENNLLPDFRPKLHHMAIDTAMAPRRKRQLWNIERSIRRHTDHDVRFGPRKSSHRSQPPACPPKLPINCCNAPQQYAAYSIHLVGGEQQALGGIAKIERFGRFLRLITKLEIWLLCSTGQIQGLGAVEDLS